MLGLDDMRETKAWGKDWRNSMDSIPPTPVYLSDATYKHVQGVFPYLIPKAKSERKDEDEAKVYRHPTTKCMRAHMKTFSLANEGMNQCARHILECTHARTHAHMSAQKANFSS